MECFKELMELSSEELVMKINETLEENKQGHNMAALMGSLGISPKHMNMYFDSMKVIKSMKE